MELDESHEDQTESDEILGLIKSELGRFIKERNYDISIEDFDGRVTKPVNYEGHLYEPSNEDGAQETVIVENYKSPTSKMLSFPEYGREKSLSYDEYRLQSPTMHPDKQQLPAITHHYLDKNKEKSFMDRSDIYSKDNHLVASYPLPDVKPQKILDLIPQEQRDKYPVEVEEITYEEYLELSKRGETFEEPLDDTEEYYDLYNDNMGFDSQKNTVRIKFDDPPSNIALSRASRRNDFDQVGVYDPNGQYIEPLQLLSDPKHMQMPYVIHQPIVLTPPHLEDGEKLAPSGTTGNAGNIPSQGLVLEEVLQESDSFVTSDLRRMGAGSEENEYIDEAPQNDFDNEEIPDIDDEDLKEEQKEEEPKIELMEENEFIKPSPVYIVYPDRDDSSTTAATTTTETGTTRSTKLFDIEYDQFL